MTYDELVAEIKWEAQMEEDSSWDTHLLLLIWDEEIQIATLQEEASLYVAGEILTSAAQNPGTGTIALPPMVKLDRLEFETGLSTGMHFLWFLPDRDDIVPPIPLPLYPRCKELTQGTPPIFNLTLIPNYLLVVLNDRILVSYWKYPILPVGGTTIFPATWIQSLKTNCVRRAMIFNASTADKKAELFAQILQKAEAVSAASNRTLDTTIKDEKGTA